MSYFPYTFRFMGHPTGNQESLGEMTQDQTQNCAPLSSLHQGKCPNAVSRKRTKSEQPKWIYLPSEATRFMLWS